MDYELAIGDRIYSSWSLRGWLLFYKFNVPVRVVSARMKSPEFADMLAPFGIAKTVPAILVHEEGDSFPVWDSIAMAETLAQRHPDRGFWPDNPAARALARSIVGEAHSSFGNLRNDCSMNLRHCYEGFEPSQAVIDDIARIETLWQAAWDMRRDRPTGPWLFGHYTIADAFFAPYATRIATYQLPIQNPKSLDYIAAHLADQEFRQWRAMGMAENYVQPGYDMDLPDVNWPGPDRIIAHAVTNETPINNTCPYSGKLVAADSLAEIDGTIIGYCNPFCRDKSVADAAAWPETMALLG